MKGPGKEKPTDGRQTEKEIVRQGAIALLHE